MRMRTNYMARNSRTCPTGSGNTSVPVYKKKKKKTYFPKRTCFTDSPLAFHRQLCMRVEKVLHVLLSLSLRTELYRASSCQTVARAHTSARAAYLCDVSALGNHGGSLR